jgi:hypothetical protein
MGELGGGLCVVEHEGFAGHGAKTSHGWHAK